MKKNAFALLGLGVLLTACSSGVSSPVLRFDREVNYSAVKHTVKGDAPHSSVSNLGSATNTEKQ